MQDSKKKQFGAIHVFGAKDFTSSYLCLFAQVLK